MLKPLGASKDRRLGIDKLDWAKINTARNFEDHSSQFSHKLRK